MIKDYAVKYFIFKQFIKNVRKDLNEQSANIFAILNEKFLIKEEVFYKNSEGILLSRFDDKCDILLKNPFKKINCQLQEVTRKNKLNKEDIFETLHFLTYDTPLGIRLLKKNIYKYVSDRSSIKDYVDYLKYNKNNVNISMHNLKKEENDCNEELDSYSLLNATNDLQSEKQLTINNTEQDVLDCDFNLNIPSSEVFTIPDFDFIYLKKLIRIYSFIFNFCSNKLPPNTTINKLVKSFKEYAYVSDIIGGIHGFLIENLLEEKQSIGLENFLKNIKSVTNSLIDEHNSKEIITGNEVGMKNWKLKSRTFLLEIYKFTKNQYILSFYNALNKKSPFDSEDTISLRISLVEFFINCYMATNIFRQVILNEAKKVKCLENKIVELEKGYNLQEERCADEVQSRIFGLKKKIILSPTKADIGQIGIYKIFLVNDEIFISTDNTFYVPGKNTLEDIINSTCVIENNTINNLKDVIKYLY